jgi:cysteine-S-conjugate beta-lyase
MRKFDFDAVIDRSNTSSSKWNVKKGELPLSTADMDLACPDRLIQALQDRMKCPIFGYTEPNPEWYESYINFFETRHHFKMDKSWMMFSTGVVPTISSCVRKLTNVGDHVVVLTPVYNIFFNSIVNNARVVHPVELLYKDGVYHIDFENLEKAFANPKTTMMILCNPANPVGRVWIRDELYHIGQLAKKYHVVVLSDEIHCEIVRPGKEYIPYASVSPDTLDNCVMAISPTKSFNIAGLQTSCVVVPNEELRKKVNRQLNTDEVAEPNAFACLASSVCLDECRDYLDAMRDYVFSNRDYVESFIKEEIPLLSVVHADATYLCWIDISEVSLDSESFLSSLREKTGLILNPGREYGLGGEGFVRMNLAYPKSVLKDALERLRTFVDRYYVEKNTITTFEDSVLK